jgi:hypothetical protein
VTRRAARLEALILVSETDEIRAVLERFYGALGLPFRSGSVGGLPVDVQRVVEALSEEVRERYGAVEGRVGPEMLERARSLREGWRTVPETG